MEVDKKKEAKEELSKTMFCTSSPMPVKMISMLNKKKRPEVRQGEGYQAEVPALLSEKVS